jgi:hypothetical protein
VPAAIKKNRRKSFEFVSKSRVSNFSHFVAETHQTRFGSKFLRGKKLIKSTKTHWYLFIDRPRSTRNQSGIEEDPQNSNRATIIKIANLTP